MKKVLLISPFFPPMNVIGSKRAINLVRRMPTRGWQPVVLAAPINDESRDDRLLELVPDATPVSYEFIGPLRRMRMRSGDDSSDTGASSSGLGFDFDFGKLVPRRLDLALRYIQPFDKRLDDVPWAIRAGLELVERHDPSLIHVNVDPWSGILVGMGIAKRAGLPLVLDLRDPWAIHGYKRTLRPMVSRWATDLAERWCFSSADRVVLNTRATYEAYVQRYEGVIPKTRFDWVRNAFEPDVYDGYSASVPPRSDDDPFVVLYFGSLRMSIGARKLLDGFGEWVEQRGLAPEAARLVFMGKVRPRDRAAVEESGLSRYVELRAPVSVRRAMDVLRDADVLVALNPPGYGLTVPGKIYDYLAAGRSILVIASNPEIGEMLEQADAGTTTPWDAPDVPACLDRVYEARRTGSLPDDVPARAARFDAAHQADAFARIYDELVDGG